MHTCHKFINAVASYQSMGQGKALDINVSQPFGKSSISTFRNWQRARKIDSYYCICWDLRATIFSAFNIFDESEHKEGRNAKVLQQIYCEATSILTNLSARYLIRRLETPSSRGNWINKLCHMLCPYQRPGQRTTNNRQQTISEQLANRIPSQLGSYMKLTFMHAIVIVVITNAPSQELSISIHPSPISIETLSIT